MKQHHQYELGVVRGRSGHAYMIGRNRGYAHVEKRVQLVVIEKLAGRKSSITRMVVVRDVGIVTMWIMIGMCGVLI